MRPNRVYIAKVLGFDDVYKVGVSSNPEARMASLKSAYGFDFELMYDTEGHHGIERKSHHFLSKFQFNELGGREFFKAPYRNILSAVIYCAMPYKDWHIEEFDWVVNRGIIGDDDLGEAFHNVFDVVKVGDGAMFFHKGESLPQRAINQIESLCEFYKTAEEEAGDLEFKYLRSLKEGFNTYISDLVQGNLEGDAE